MNMDTAWFYRDGTENRGPMSLEALVQALVAIPDPRGVYVWHAGMADWQQAGALPELAGRLPPPLYRDPLASVPFVDAEAIAKYYRRLVLLVGIEIVAQIPLVVAPISGVGTGIRALLGLGLIVLLVMMSVTAYKLTQHMGSGLPILWAISMFIPCWNVLALLLLSSKAQSWCQRYGIKVGFFGPTQESIDELKRRLLSSHFE